MYPQERLPCSLRSKLRDAGFESRCIDGRGADRFYQVLVERDSWASRIRRRNPTLSRGLPDPDWPSKFHCGRDNHSHDYHPDSERTPDHGRVTLAAAFLLIAGLVVRLMAPDEEEDNE